MPASWDPFPAGHEEPVDVVLWNTGFRPAMNHLAPLRLREPGGGIRMLDEVSPARDRRILLVGYGSTASTIGANRAGRLAGDRDPFGAGQRVLQFQRAFDDPRFQRFIGAADGQPLRLLLVAGVRHFQQCQFETGVFRQGFQDAIGFLAIRRAVVKHGDLPAWVISRNVLAVNPILG